MRSARCLVALLVGASLLGTPALAAERNPSTKKPEAAEKAPAPPPAGTDATPPYESQLLRLAEIMGTLAYMRDLCGAGDGAEYRARMSALLEAEATAQDRRERLVGSYNRGYRGYEATYRSCTPNARVVIARLLKEGEQVAHEISYRFGGS